MYQLVAQKDDFGCGVACIASRLGISYESALSKFSQPERAKTRGFTFKDLNTVLLRNGLVYKLRYAPKMRQDILEEVGTFVFIRRDRNYPYGHYLLKTSNGWMDPWGNFRTDRKVESALAMFRDVLPGGPLYALEWMRM